MRTFRVLFALFCLSGAAGALAVGPAPAAPAPTAPVSAADFARGNQFSHPKLSPDGRHLAITAREASGKSDTYRLLVYRVADQQPASMLTMPARELPIDYEWATDTRLVVEKGRLSGSLDKPRHTGEVLATDIDGKNQVFLFGPDPGESMFIRAKVDDRGWGFVAGTPQPRNGHVYLRVIPWESRGRSQLYDLDAATGAKRLIADIDTPDLNFVMRNDGGVGYAVGVDENAEPVVFRSESRDAWTRLTRAQTGSHLEPIAFTAGDTDVLAYYSETGGPLALVRQTLPPARARCSRATRARASSRRNGPACRACRTQ